jgi:HSP20 family protein
MKIIRYQTSPLYSPAANYPTLRDEMDRLFEVAFPMLGSLQHGDFPMDLYQSKDGFTVRAEVPGFRKEDISAEVADGILTVTAHQKADGTKEGETSQTGVAVQERRLSRAISLPENLDLDKIQAGYENGMLTVTLPKREEAKPKQIAIEVK